jgi:hypothetical protein
VPAATGPPTTGRVLGPPVHPTDSSNVAATIHRVPGKEDII